MSYGALLPDPSAVVRYTREEWGLISLVENHLDRSYNAPDLLLVNIDEIHLGADLLDADWISREEWEEYRDRVELYFDLQDLGPANVLSVYDVLIERGFTDQQILYVVSQPEWYAHEAFPGFVGLELDVIGGSTIQDEEFLEVLTAPSFLCLDPYELEGEAATVALSHWMRRVRGE